MHFLDCPGRINENELRSWTNEIRKLADHDHDEKVVLRISSSGGSSPTALQILGFLQQIPQHLTTVGLGKVDSAAITIFLAGDRRLITPYTSFFIHESKHDFHEIPSSQLRERTEHALFQEELAKNFFVSQTTISRKTLDKWYIEGKCLSPEEAKEIGLVHEIVTESIFKQ